MRSKVVGSNSQTHTSVHGLECSDINNSESPLVKMRNGDMASPTDPFEGSSGNKCRAHFRARPQGSQCVLNDVCNRHKCSAHFQDFKESKEGTSNEVRANWSRQGALWEPMGASEGKAGACSSMGANGS
eukprot:1157557-Pelagomonas_calceolata.AAC.7